MCEIGLLSVVYRISRKKSKPWNWEPKMWFAIFEIVQPKFLTVKIPISIKIFEIFTSSKHSQFDLIEKVTKLKTEMWYGKFKPKVLAFHVVFTIKNLKKIEISVSTWTGTNSFSDIFVNCRHKNQVGHHRVTILGIFWCKTGNITQLEPSSPIKWGLFCQTLSFLRFNIFHNLTISHPV